ncbi:MAG: hypothetical protein U0176_19655 [Bacteroidia bacterium]
MKTPKSKPESPKAPTKDGKPQQQAAAKPPKVAVIPGFGMANATINRDGTYRADVKCVNGDPNKNPSAVLPKGSVYYKTTTPIPSTAALSVYLPDQAKIDPNYLFFWENNAADPMRLGGGITKGTLQEGSQRAAGSTAPLQNPIFTSDWVNGTPWRITIFLTETFGLTLYEGDVVFGLVTMDPATGTPVMRAMAKREGGCLDTVA